MSQTPPDTQDDTLRNIGLVTPTGTGLKPAYDASWAVVIGIDNYQHVHKLKHAVNDAIGTAKLLIEQLGFRRDRMFVLLDPPPEPSPEGELPFDLIRGEASKTAIEELLFTRLPDLVGPDDRVVIFFAGHGDTRKLPGSGDEQKGYLIPATGEPGKFHTLIQMDDVMETGDLLAAKHVFYLLDACFSGLATTRAEFELPNRYQEGMLTKKARQVLTAGTAEQVVADGGPGGHSLFTGFVLNGLSGDAAQPGATAITASDLMVYVKNRVGMATGSQQTPDFGALLGHKSGGDFVFRLPPEDDDYERAMAALGQGQIASFRALTARAMSNRPLSAETIYVEYRLRLLDNDIDAAIDCIHRLRQADRTRSKIPLSDNDLEELAAVLPFWQPVFQVPEGNPPLVITLWAGPDAKALELVAPGTLETSAGASPPLFSVPAHGVGQWRVLNQDVRPLHIYYTQFSPSGRLEVGPLLASEDVLFSGLQPGREERSDWFPLAASPALVQTRIFAVPEHVRRMISTPSFNARAIMTFDESARKKLALFQRITIWYRTVAAT